MSNLGKKILSAFVVVTDDKNRSRKSHLKQKKFSPETA